MVVREKDILISKIRPGRGTICLIDKNSDGFIASTGFAIEKSKLSFAESIYFMLYDFPPS